jgi:putative cardiolipin synthase
MHSGLDPAQVQTHATSPTAAGVRFLVLFGLALLLSACGSLPHVERGRDFMSDAIGVSAQTTLGRIALDSTPSAELSGFRLMPLGNYSFDTRLQLIRRAEVSLDVQYYHLEPDDVGRFFMRALRDAANRGVRVRLFIDDLYTGGADELLLALEAHPNIEVRLFNPFCCARSFGQLTRFAAATGDWSRVNHRMHNKLIVADGAMAVIGGRNIANEYFLRSQSENFIDVDAFTVGFIVGTLQGLFDRYWNSNAAHPLRALARTDLTQAELQDKFERETGQASTPAPMGLPGNDILGYGPIADDLDGGKLGLIWGKAYAFADHPDKPFDKPPAAGTLRETSVTYNVFEAMRMASSSVVASSPYFVPGPLGMGLLRGLRGRGVAVSVLTNSLAATDEFVVHAGYSRYRQQMLEMGVDLYELSSSRLKANRHPFLFGGSLGRLHAKLVVIDKRLSFIGSMNLDPRSAVLNTELGTIIDSPELAKELLHIIDIDRLQSAYRVRLAPDGRQLQWLSADDEKELVLSVEPDSSAWLRFKSWLLGPLIPDELL